MGTAMGHGPKQDGRADGDRRRGVWRRHLDRYVPLVAVERDVDIIRPFRWQRPPGQLRQSPEPGLRLRRAA